MFKQNQIIAIVSATLLTLSSPAAALAATYTVTSTDDSGAGTLRDTVASTVDGDEVILPSNGTAYSVTSNPVNINSSISIQGAGQATTTIDGGGTSQIFRVAANKTVSISGVTIQNGNDANDGGAIHNAGTTSISDSTLKNNTASSGGAISNTGDLTLSNVVLDNNTAQVGGALVTNLFNDPGDNSVTVLSSTFSDNSATNVGGAIDDVGSNLSIQNSIFTGNSTGGSAGAIFASAVNSGNDTQVAISDSSFQGNHAGDTGGGIYVTGARLVIQSSTFDDNTADNLGGGIATSYLYEVGDTTITVSDSSLTYNTASQGAGIHNFGANLTATGLTVDHNAGTWGVGILHTGGTLTLTNSHLDSNANSGDYGEGVALYAANLYTQDDTHIIVQGGTFDNNSLDMTVLGPNGTNVYGGVLTIQGVTATIQGTSISNNLVQVTTTGVNTSAEVRGGLIYLSNYSDPNDEVVILDDVTISNNLVSVSTPFDNNLRGLVENLGTDLRVINSTIAGNDISMVATNQANLSGIFNNAGRLSLDHSTITGNSADLASYISQNRGLIIYGEQYNDLNDSPISIIDSVISGNSATSSATFALTGSLVSAMYNDLTVSGTAITGNTTSGGLPNDGGGAINSSIWNDPGDVRLDIVNSQITNNTFSGTSVTSYGAAVTVNHSFIRDNIISTPWSGTPYGGGINLYNGGFGSNAVASTISNSIISGNNSTNGGGIYNYGTALTIQDSVISNNQATEGNGGGIFLDYCGCGDPTSVTIRRSTISGNYAFGNGAGISNEGDSSLVIENSTFSDNHGEPGNTWGGAIDNFGPSLTIVNSTFSGNTSESGGAISQENGTLSIQGSLFANNVSNGEGGALSLWNQSQTTITNSTFTGNSAAGNGGGAIDVVQAPLTLSGVTIAGNTCISQYCTSNSGGLWAEDGSLIDAVNTIIAMNNGGDCSQAISDDLGHNLDSDSTCFTNPTSLHGDPKLGMLQDNGGPTWTMAIGTDSPAFNAGDPTACETTDQRGESRPALGGCDIGAYELQPTPPPSPQNPPSGGASAESVTENSTNAIILAAAPVTTKKAKKIAAQTATANAASDFGRGDEAQPVSDQGFVHKVMTFLTNPLVITFSGLVLALLLLMFFVRRHGQDQPA